VVELGLSWGETDRMDTERREEGTVRAWEWFYFREFKSASDSGTSILISSNRKDGSYMCQGTRNDPEVSLHVRAQDPIENGLCDIM
jgi:hypothetical protein